MRASGGVGPGAWTSSRAGVSSRPVKTPAYQRSSGRLASASRAGLCSYSPVATARGDGASAALHAHDGGGEGQGVCPSSGCAGRAVGRTPPYRVSVPVKVSRPSPRPDSSTPLMRPPPRRPSRRPRPFTTFQSLVCFTPGGVAVKVIVRVPPGQRNDLSTNRLGITTGPSMNVPRAQKAESPMVDPDRTSPDVLPRALGGARCVLIRIGSLLSAAVVEVVSTSGDAVVPPSFPWSSPQAAMPRRETISSTAKAVLA